MMKIVLTLMVFGLLVACGDQATVYKTEVVMPQIDKDLRTPCPEPNPEVKTIEDISLLLADQKATITCANGKIVQIDETLTAFEIEVLEKGVEDD